MVYRTGSKIFSVLNSHWYNFWRSLKLSIMKCIIKRYTLYFLTCTVGSWSTWILYIVREYGNSRYVPLPESQQANWKEPGTSIFEAKGVRGCDFLAPQTLLLQVHWSLLLGLFWILPIANQPMYSVHCIESFFLTTPRQKKHYSSTKHVHLESKTRRQLNDVYTR